MSPRTRGRARTLALAATLVAAVVLLVAAPAALAAGNDVGRNLADLLKGYAGEVYGGIVAVVGLIFLVNRRYKELGMFLVAAVIVAWLVFSPGQVADTARAIGRRVMG